MAQSIAKVYLHIVFSTKHRAPFLLEKKVRNERHKYLGGTCGDLDCPSIIVDGVEDHVHVLLRYCRTRSIAEVVRELKRESSKWAKAPKIDLAEFQWQDGYGAFSVSHSQVDEVTKYIANQEAHHAHMTFQDEYRLLLEKYEVEYDERYVWD